MLYSEEKRKKICNFNDYNVAYYSSRERIKVVMTIKYSNYMINWHIHTDKNIPDIIEGNESLSRAHFQHILDRKKLFKNGFFNKFENYGGTISTNEALRRLDTNKVDLSSRFANTMKYYINK